MRTRPDVDVMNLKEVLSEKEMQDLFRKFKYEGDQEAREKLIEHNMRMVPWIVKKHFKSYEDYQDLVSEGYAALIKAVDHFDPDRGFKFMSFAQQVIRNQIRHVLRDEHRRNIMNCSYLEDVFMESSDGDQLTLADIIPAKDDTLELLCEEESRRELREAVDLLPEKERYVIKRRYYRSESLYLQDNIGRELGIGQVMVSRIEKQAKNHLRELIGGIA